MFARFTTEAAAGLFNGTLMISMRSSEDSGFLSGVSRLQTGSSFGERMPAEPET